MKTRFSDRQRLSRSASWKLSALVPIYSPYLHTSTMDMVVLLARLADLLAENQLDNRATNPDAGHVAQWSISDETAQRYWRGLYSAREAGPCQVSGPEFVKTTSEVPGTICKIRNNNRQRGWLVPGIPVKRLVDTGGNITILRRDYLEKIPVSDRPALNQGGSSIALADERVLPFICQGTFSLRVGTTQGDHQVWIADIEPEGILGLDFVRSRKCQLVLREGQYELICIETKVDPKLGSNCEPSMLSCSSQRNYCYSTAKRDPCAWRHTGLR